MQKYGIECQGMEASTDIPTSYLTNTKVEAVKENDSSTDLMSEADDSFPPPPPNLTSSSSHTSPRPPTGQLETPSHSLFVDNKNDFPPPPLSILQDLPPPPTGELEKSLHSSFVDNENDFPPPPPSILQDLAPATTTVGYIIK